MRKNFKTIDPKKKISLISEWKQTKNPKVLEDIIAQHYSIIYAIANQYGGSGISKDDLVSEGLLGMLTALEKFDDSKNVKFSTYAYFWVKAKVLRFVKTANPFSKTSEDNEDLDRSHSHFANLDDLLNSPVIKSKNKVSALDMEMQEICLNDLGVAQKELEETSIEEDFSELLRLCLLSLSKQKQIVLEQRWLKEEKATFEELSKKLNLSSERIRQLEKEAFKDIRIILSSKLGSLRGTLYFSYFIYQTTYKNYHEI